MAYRRKSTGYRSTTRRAPARRRRSTYAPRRAARGRTSRGGTQTVKLELHHIMTSPVNTPVPALGGGFGLPSSSSSKQPKL